MTNFFIITIILLIITDIILNIINWSDRQELKQLEQKQRKRKKYTKEEIKAYEIFCEALNKGVEIDFSGVKCQLVGFGKFSADGVIYELNIDNFLKVLNGK